MFLETKKLYSEEIIPCHPFKIKLNLVFLEKHIQDWRARTLTFDYILFTQT